MTPPATTLVVPTLGRTTLADLLVGLDRQEPALDAPVLVVDDRPGNDVAPLDLPAGLRLDVTVLRAGGRGPARARNLGWRHARTPWVSFLDDDVQVPADWYRDLLRDLAAADTAEAVGTAARVHVPLPSDRRPTDWERGTAGLATARWITADLSYRRAALAAVGGFDERFPRAFREDADLALRLGADRGTVGQGERRIVHPVRPAGFWVSVRQQAGNADDMLMRARHGRDWHARAGAPRGRRPRHLVVTLAGAVGVAGLLDRRPRLAAAGLAGWLLGTAELAHARIRPGPRTGAEVARMVLTSVAIPPAASWHTLVGLVRHRRAAPWRGLPEAVLLDRDGTLVHDVPYNGDPDAVRPMSGAREALDRLRAEGLRLGIVTNQSAVGRGLITPAQLGAVNSRVQELLGPFETVAVCPHADDEGCSCRKPAPGLVLRACADLGTAPERAVMVGDIGSDVAAADAAGASAYLVPTPATRAEERATPRLAATLGDAVDRILAGEW